MKEYVRIRNLKIIRLFSRLFPLKNKLNLLVPANVKQGSKIAIAYFNSWFICFDVTPKNLITIQELILMGARSIPEFFLIKKIKKILPDNIVMIDVGGNSGGIFSLFLDKSKLIYVFEPIPSLYKTIENSILVNNEKKVVLIKKALGNSNEFVSMLDNNNSSVVNGATNAEVLTVEMSALDIELKSLQKIDFIKIDVEGFELFVLEGSQKILKEKRPFLLLELHPFFIQNFDKNYTDVINFIENCNYKIEYYSFLNELRMPKYRRIFERWKGNKGKQFDSKNDFIKDLDNEVKLSSYHLFCIPL